MAEAEKEDGQFPTLVSTVFPALSFWYGLSFWEMVSMPNLVLKAYVEALPRLQAEMQLLMLGPAMAPHMTKGGRSSFVSRLRRQQEPPQVQPRLLPREAFEATLANIGIGIVKEPKQ